MDSGPRSWRSGTALFARPMVPLSSGTSQPSISRTSGGATASTVARSRDSRSAASNLAPVALHEPGLVALPVSRGGGLALVVLLLSLGERDLQFGHALVVPIELGRDDRAAVALHGADQLVDLLALQEQLP